MSILSVQNLSFSYGKKQVLSDISFELSKGLVSVLGANGSGKSTLVSLIGGRLRPESGTVTYDGENVYSIPPKRRARRIACVYQKTEAVFPYTCYEIAEMGLYPHKPKPDAADADFIRSVMRKTDTLQFENKLITELSGGERQRVLLARALVQKPELLILDEAMSGFDIAVRLNMTALLKRLAAERGMTIVFVRHDIDAAFCDSDRILALRDGKLMYDGTPTQLMTERFFMDIYNVKAEINNGRFNILNI